MNLEKLRYQLHELLGSEAFVLPVEDTAQRILDLVKKEMENSSLLGQYVRHREAPSIRGLVTTRIENLRGATQVYVEWPDGSTGTMDGTRVDESSVIPIAHRTSEGNCSVCGRPVTRVDFDSRYFHLEDTKWGVPPRGDDPGVVVPKRGAQPLRAGCEKDR